MINPKQIKNYLRRSLHEYDNDKIVIVEYDKL